MKKILIVSLLIPLMATAQDYMSSTKYPHPFTSGSAKFKPFDNASRKFKDWSVSVGGGGSFLHAADVNSFYDGKVNFGWNSYLTVDKQLSHTFGLSLVGSVGQTNQKALLPGEEGVRAGVATAWTKYHQISILGDINFSNLMRRIDFARPLKLALHGYVGMGFLGYNTLLLDNDTSRWNDIPKRIPIEIEQKIGLDSFFFQFGTGLSYNLSKIIDLEARVMYIVTGDDSFDGGGHGSNAIPKYNAITSGHSDNILTTTLGLSFKLGNHDTHLRWHDPLQDTFMRAEKLENTPSELVACSTGDTDNDGVCDDWDRQLNTPAGARVDGAGVALDIDLDGIIDLYDKCVTVPGTVANQGCPNNYLIIN